MTRIITHPGSAHKDDFLSTCVLLAVLDDAVVERREPCRDDLDDPLAYVVDVGMEYDPVRHNFDHHQDPELPCGFHLVMRHLGYHEAAAQVYLWYQHMNVLDVRGADRAASHLGIDTDILMTTASPIEGYVLSLFAAVTRLEPGDFLYRLMRDLGRDKLDLIDRKLRRLGELEATARVVPMRMFKAVVSTIADNPKLSLELYLRRLDDRRIVVAIFPSSRGPGWELLRLDGAAVVDFRRIEAEPNVRFVHPRGFLAKTAGGLAVDEALRLAGASVLESAYAI